jgi:hypothetical protein
VPVSALPGLTFLRLPQRLEPPSQGYVFAQPQRSTIAEEQVIRRVQEREVVEVIHKEVQQAMNAAPPLGRFTRADYETIAENVFGTLARRMIVERERLGLRGQ